MVFLGRLGDRDGVAAPIVGHVLAVKDRDAAVVPPGSTVLVTGASGYVGGRLVGELLHRGYRVRCLVRTPSKLSRAPWREQVEVVEGDVTGDLTHAMRDVDAAYYLVHSIGASKDWATRDRDAAANFRDAAATSGLRRIVYLGGLGASDDGLSEHLESRHDVGRELAAGPVPVTELRAAVIIGSGSASFEMLRYLVDVLPVMITPRWVDTRCQPVAIRDVLRYLVDALTAPVAGKVLEVGGPDVLTYRQMMRIYAEEAGLRRRVILPVPVLTPRLSSYWIGLVTPIPPSLARPLIDSLVNDVVVRGDGAIDAMPGPMLSYREAVARALRRVSEGDVPTRWSQAELGGRHAGEPLPTDPSWAGGSVLADRREREVAASPAAVYAAISRIGGATGWHSGDWLWGVRGAIDALAGGVGLRRGRVHPSELAVGDPVDFWRVEVAEPSRLVRLRAEMRLPGEAWLEWELEDHGGATLVRQTARFHPRGLWGRMYWYAVAPFHRFVFPGVLVGIASDAVSSEAVSSETVSSAGEREVSAPRGPGTGRGRPRGCAPTG
jgi:uncharacterized protein YbjT (DUF2867 family)